MVAVVSCATESDMLFKVIVVSIQLSWLTGCENSF